MVVFKGYFRAFFLSLFLFIHASASDLQSLSYQELTAQVTPARCSELLGGLSTLTNSSLPTKVKNLRKFALYCRDFLDIFVFAYPESVDYTGEGGAVEKVDVWQTFRTDLDRLYEDIGAFQDLSAAHISYTTEEAQKLLQKALDSKATVISDDQKYNFTSFLSNPALTLVSRTGHHLSRLFWGTSRPGAPRPTTNRTGLENIAYLTSDLLERIAQYDKTFLSLKDIWIDENQEKFHNMRKLVRGVRTVLSYFPEAVHDYRPVARCVVTMQDLYDRIGTLNDVISAYRWYRDHNHTEEASATQLLIDIQWGELTEWYREKSVRASLEWLRVQIFEMSFGRPKIGLNDLDNEIPQGIIFAGHSPAPDMDSIGSAIGAAWLLNGTPATPAALNKESTAALQYLKLKAPEDISVLYKPGNKLGLVDYNQYDQASSFVTEHMGDVSAIIDHHALVPRPVLPTRATYIYIRPVGSCCTVVTDMIRKYCPRRVPENVAGPLLAGIISDTLNFTSPATTPEDNKALEYLLPLSGISNLTDLVYTMMEARSDYTGMTPDQIVAMDFKSFTIAGSTLGFSNAQTVKPETLLEPTMRQNLRASLQLEKEILSLKYAFFAVEDFLRKKSTLICGDDVDMVLAQKAFPDAPVDWEAGTLDTSPLISRKEEFIPAFEKVLPMVNTVNAVAGGDVMLSGGGVVVPGVHALVNGVDERTKVKLVRQ